MRLSLKRLVVNALLAIVRWLGEEEAYEGPGFPFQRSSLLSGSSASAVSASARSTSNSVIRKTKRRRSWKTHCSFSLRRLSSPSSSLLSAADNHQQPSQNSQIPQDSPPSLPFTQPFTQPELVRCSQILASLGTYQFLFQAMSSAGY